MTCPNEGALWGAAGAFGAEATGVGYEGGAGIADVSTRWVPPFELRDDQLLGYDEAVARVTAALCFGIDLTLETTQEIMAELGHPERCYRCLQIAGTNGKTSTSRYTAALLRGEGLHVGLYTSPHLVSYAERMEVDGAPVSEAAFARGVSWALAAWERVQARNAEMGRLGCTEFELLTAAAIAVYAEAGVDAAVLEVGLGGRWDATSAVRTCGCCVTGIGLDHMKILGDTLGQIAGEKAAVIHAGNPCVLGPDAARPAEVLDVMLAQCAEQGVTPTIVAVDDDEVLSVAAGLPRTHVQVAHRPEHLGDELALDVNVQVEVPGTPAGTGGCTVATGARDADAELGAPHLVDARYRDVRLVAPDYQAANVACALSVATAFFGRSLDADAARRALAACPTPGRFDVVRSEPLILLDACHNPQSAAAFARALQEVEPDKAARPTLLFATLADKDHRGIAQILAPLFDRIVVTQSDSPRALPATRLADEVRELCGAPEQGGPQLTVISDAGVALASLLDADEPFICCGTITLIGQIKGLLQAR